MTYIYTICFLLIFSVFGFAQNSEKKTKIDYSTPTSKAIKSSPAYAELILRRTIVKADLEELLVSYTEEFPKAKDARAEIDLINFELSRLLNTKVTDSCQLSDSLGQLMMKKIDVAIELKNLIQKYNGDHPSTLRTKRKLEVYEKAILEILPGN
ncbi:MAG: hypothetical protein ABIP06_06150 [Pyrinomonadaceae bacterium]